MLRFVVLYTSSYVSSSISICVIVSSTSDRTMLRCWSNACRKKMMIKRKLVASYFKHESIEQTNSFIIKLEHLWDNFLNFCGLITGSWFGHLSHGYFYIWMSFFYRNYTHNVRNKLSHKLITWLKVKCQ